MTVLVTVHGTNLTHDHIAVELIQLALQSYEQAAQDGRSLQWHVTLMQSGHQQ